MTLGFCKNCELSPVWEISITHDGKYEVFIDHKDVSEFVDTVTESLDGYVIYYKDGSKEEAKPHFHRIA